MKAYHTNRPITRPVLIFWPWWQVDVQLLAPYGWCPGCGAEVYDPTEVYCPGCREDAKKRPLARKRMKERRDHGRT